MVSIGMRLAATTTLVVAIVSALLAFELTAHERARLLESKAQAANMVVALLATSLSAAIDFGDADDVGAQLENLRTNGDISAAAVWAGDGRVLLAEWHQAGTAGLDPFGPHETTMIGADRLVVTRDIIGRSAAKAAEVRVAFSLAKENDVYRSSRVRILVGALAFAVAIAALLIVVSRYQIVRPLRRLAEAARRLENGDLSANVNITSRDEIGALASAFNTMGQAVAYRHDRMAREVELAEQIQRSILPQSLDVPGLEVSAAMVPATEVGGDYYDVLRVDDGCWFGIGDVAGHGLNAGLIMLMIQSMVGALVRKDPGSAPREVVTALNEALFDNVQGRLRREDHATLTLLRYHRDGRILFAGAHEDIIVYRASTGQCEIIPTPGTWVATRRNTARVTVDSRLQLEDGDILILHTDGMTEARDAHGQMFGMERLCEQIERMASATAAEIQTHLVGVVRQWTHAQQDDLTILVARYRSSPGS